MNARIHGPEVIGMMVDMGRVLARDPLLSAANGLFGADARYSTCSVANTDADELIDFPV